MELKLQHRHSAPFELVLVTRDASGNPTGTKSFEHDSAYEISRFYLRNQGKPKKKVKSKDGEKGKQTKLHISKKDGHTTAAIDLTERVTE